MPNVHQNRDFFSKYCMQLSFFIALILFSALSLLFRLFGIPASDYPDISTISIDFLLKLGLERSGLADALGGDPSCVSQGFPAAFFLGSSYNCDNIFVNYDYSIFGVLVAALLILSLLLVKISFPLPTLFEKHIRLASLFIVLAPCTFYYLVSPHSDVFYNLIGIISVFSVVCIAGSPYSTRLFTIAKIFKSFPFYLIGVIYGLIIAVIPDLQSLIVLFLFSVVYAAASPQLQKIYLFHSLTKAMRVQSFRILHFQPFIKKWLLLRLAILFLIIFVIFQSNLLLMNVLAFLPGHLGTIGVHYGTHYSDVLFRYPLPLRWFNIMQTAVMRTPSFWGPSFISWLFILLSFIYGSLRLFASNSNELPDSLKLSFFFSVVFLIGIAAVFPAFTNFKYFLPLLPVLVLPFTFVPRTTFIAVSVLYLDLVFGFLWNS